MCSELVVFTLHVAGLTSSRFTKYRMFTSGFIHTTCPNCDYSVLGVIIILWILFRLTYQGPVVTGMWCRFVFRDGDVRKLTRVSCLIKWHLMLMSDPGVFCLWFLSLLFTLPSRTLSLLCCIAGILCVLSFSRRIISISVIFSSVHSLRPSVHCVLWTEASLLLLFEDRFSDSRANLRGGVAQTLRQLFFHRW